MHAAREIGHLRCYGCRGRRLVGATWTWRDQKAMPTRTTSKIVTFALRLTLRGIEQKLPAEGVTLFVTFEETYSPPLRGPRQIGARRIGSEAAPPVFLSCVARTGQRCMNVEAPAAPSVQGIVGNRSNAPNRGDGDALQSPDPRRGYCSRSRDRTIPAVKFYL
jgi:hypothetical protein